MSRQNENFYLKLLQNKNMLRLQVSIGEAIDKWNILHIKKDYVNNEQRLADIQYEIDCLKEDLQPILSNVDVQRLYKYLDYFNRNIWHLCDLVRVHDVNTYIAGSDPLYAQRCVDIIRFNDARFRVKNKINLISQSNIREQKNFRGNYICLKFKDVEFMEPVLYYLSMCYDHVYVDCDKHVEFKEPNISYELKNMYLDFNAIVTSTYNDKVKLIKDVFHVDYETIKTL